MALTQTEQPQIERLPYEKPTLRSISLVADQVLAEPCKGSPANDNMTISATSSCLTIGCKDSNGS